MAIPPVWEPSPVLVRAAAVREGLASLPGRTEFVNSGTAALALATRRLWGGTASIEVGKRPEVLIPAYCCPSVVAAVHFAGGRCVACDLDDDGLSMSADSIAANSSPATVGVVSVRLFGLEDRDEDAVLSQAFAPGRIVVDCCQAHPRRVALQPDRGYVFSFGRGKAAPALVGGAFVPALWRRESEGPAQARAWSIVRPFRRAVAAAFRALAYDVLTRSLPFLLVQRSGLFGLGETIYRPLNCVASLGPTELARVGAAIALTPTPPTPATQRLLAWVLAQHRAGVLRVPKSVLMQEDSGFLLRIPVFAESGAQRDRIVAGLIAAGLGASAMYGAAIDQIPGARELVLVRSGVKWARHCAERIFTLPNHARVTERHVDLIEKVVSAQS